MWPLWLYSLLLRATCALPDTLMGASRVGFLTGKVHAFPVLDFNDSYSPWSQKHLLQFDANKSLMENPITQVDAPFLRYVDLNRLDVGQIARDNSIDDNVWHNVSEQPQFWEPSVGGPTAQRLDMCRHKSGGK